MEERGWSKGERSDGGIGIEERAMKRRKQRRKGDIKKTKDIEEEGERVMKEVGEMRRGGYGGRERLQTGYG